MSFTLIGNDLVWYKGYHQSMFEYEFGFPSYLANALRYYFPRGASVWDREDGQVTDASEELRPYAREIADQLGISPMRINFDNRHYLVRTTSELLMDQIIGHDMYEDDGEYMRKIGDFLRRYLPDMYQMLSRTGAWQNFQQSEMA